MLHGMLNGTAIAVGLPLLDCFLSANGTALADGSPIPVRFGTWFQGLGFNPGFWEPVDVGARYQMRPFLQPLASFRDKINIFSGLQAFLDGQPNEVHSSGPAVVLGGSALTPGQALPPSLDTLVADSIGTRSRFRSLEVNCAGSQESLSRRSATARNPAEFSPIALYKRIFGADFRDPNAADFTPDPKVMVRRSVLSAIGEQRQDLLKQVGAVDKARLDDYFTGLRGLEQQLELEMQKPPPLKACTVPAASTVADEKTSDHLIVDDVIQNHKLFAQLLAHALACDQTRVFNVVLSAGASGLTRPGEANNFHVFTHEEGVDPKLGYQPNVGWFMDRVVEALRDMLVALDGIREGDGTLLDHSLLLYNTDVAYARYHTIDNIPIMTVGSGAGRIKTGIHIQAKNEAISRVGLTIQQVMGSQISSWGTGTNRATKPFSEIVV
jgi:hypothetical protein